MGSDKPPLLCSDAFAGVAGILFRGDDRRRNCSRWPLTLAALLSDSASDFGILGSMEEPVAPTAPHLYSLLVSVADKVCFR